MWCVCSVTKNIFTLNERRWKALFYSIKFHIRKNYLISSDRVHVITSQWLQIFIYTWRWWRICFGSQKTVVGNRINCEKHLFAQIILFCWDCQVKRRSFEWQTQIKRTVVFHTWSNRKEWYRVHNNCALIHLVNCRSINTVIDHIHLFYSLLSVILCLSQTINITGYVIFYTTINPITPSICTDVKWCFSLFFSFSSIQLLFYSQY